jgi:hypothetical protein
MYNIANVKFTKKELSEYLKMCSSIDSKGNIHPRVMFGANGKPLPAQEYQKVIGAHKLVEKCDFSKTPYEKARLKRLKTEYKSLNS